jgi:hypothetical protein
VLLLAILAMSSVGLAGGNYAPPATDWDTGCVEVYVADIVWWLGPEALVVLGPMGQQVVMTLSPDGAIIMKSNYVASGERSDAGVLYTSVAGWQISVVSSDGMACVDSDVAVMTWQSPP